MARPLKTYKRKIPERLTPYEARVLQELKVWAKEDKSRFGGLGRMAAEGLSSLFGGLISDKGKQDAMESAVLKALTVVDTAANGTFTYEGLVKSGRKFGITAGAIDGLQDEDLEKLDAFAQTFASENTIYAAIEGGFLGAGGLLALAADIPALIGINFRVVRQIGSAYGFHMDAFEEKQYILKIFELSARTGPKDTLLRDLEAIERRVRAMSAEQVTESHGDLSQVPNIRDFARRLAITLLQRKLAQLVPIVGGLAGAGFNYLFTKDTAEAAYMLFRKRWIERRFDQDLILIPGPPPATLLG